MPRWAAVALCGLALILAAFTFGAAPLFVAGIGFASIGLVTPLWVLLTARSATIDRRLVADRVIEHEPVEAVIEVRRGPLGLPGAEIHDPLARTPVDLRGPLALLTGAQRAQVRIVARFPRRGRRRLPAPVLFISDGLSLARTVRGGGPGQEVLVLPRTEPVRWSLERRGRRRAVDGGHSEEALAAVDVDGLRAYRPGTPASRIQWSALARGAGLLERRLRADAEARPLVVLDARLSSNGQTASSAATPPPAKVDEVDPRTQLGHLDAAVRAAASLTLELALQGGVRVLLPGDRRPVMIEQGLRGWPAVHARLALVEPSSPGSPPRLGDGIGLGRVFYVAAHHLPRLPAPLARGRGGPHVLVLPEALAPAAALTAFRVSGCCGHVQFARANSIASSTDADLTAVDP
jgi:uncharacterized protein (DUF58 family)